MATVQDDIVDAELRHTIYLIKYSTSVYNRQSKLLDEALSDLINKLNIRTPQSGEMTTKRLEAMIDAIGAQSKELFKALQSAVNGDMKELAAYEAAFHTSVISGAYPIELALIAPTANQVYAATMSRPFQGRLLKEWWSKQELSTKDAFKAAVRTGYIEGETLDQIARRLRGVGKTTKDQTRNIVQTAVMHMNQVALDKTSEANKDILKGDVWKATLDGRTCPICAPRDGKIYPFGKGPRVPAHIKCRCRRIPKVKSWKEMGFADIGDKELSQRRFVADKRTVSQIPKKDRDRLVGITSDRTYNDWIRNQRREFVEDVWGPKRAKLILDGNVNIERFVDNQGRSLTLDEIKVKEPKAWKGSGL